MGIKRYEKCKQKIASVIKKGIYVIKYFPVFKEKQFIRCFHDSIGYGDYTDLTPEEYDIYCRATNITVETMIEKLDKIIEGLS
jgi:hypothetical protein